ncbi:fasciclin-like arabinogalactan protein 11-like, partial [Trifolium medium]|nr:fasciclin-like arabinogalactan protein 11-like [Trifolium medium]
NTTMDGIIYTDKHLAIYKFGKVLLPTEFFSVAKAPGKARSLAPEPSALTPKADTEKPLSPDSSDSSQVKKPSNDNSGTVKMNV